MMTQKLQAVASLLLLLFYPAPLVVAVSPAVDDAAGAEADATGNNLHNNLHNADDYDDGEIGATSQQQRRQQSLLPQLQRQRQKRLDGGQHPSVVNILRDNDGTAAARPLRHSTAASKATRGGIRGQRRRERGERLVGDGNDRLLIGAGAAAASYAASSTAVKTKKAFAKQCKTMFLYAEIDDILANSSVDGVVSVTDEVPVYRKQKTSATTTEVLVALWTQSSITTGNQCTISAFFTLTGGATLYFQGSCGDSRWAVVRLYVYTCMRLRFLSYQCDLCE